MFTRDETNISKENLIFCMSVSHTTFPGMNPAKDSNMYKEQEWNFLATEMKIDFKFNVWVLCVLSLVECCVASQA